MSTLILLGMPHGAIDHYLYFHLKQQKMSSYRLIKFIFIYLLFSFVMAGLWISFPIICIVGLIALTWAHWGEGDMIFERSRGHNVTWLFALWRGSLPMILPVVLYAADYQRVLEAGVRAVNTSKDLSAFNWLIHPMTPVTIVSFMLILAGLNWFFICKDRTVSRSQQFRWFGEDIFLVALFLLLPPLVSIGIYFSLWHARRHILVTCKELGPPVWKGKSVQWKKFYHWAAPFTIAGILLMCLIPIIYQNRENLLMHLVGCYLITLWSFTWPHAMICRLLNKKY
ncbi:MAG: Brp/Blh family beta-carotene 15,15'-dioxygenase [Verrucomicrobiota bacterium]